MRSVGELVSNNLRIPLRNLVRYRSRTLFGLLAIVFGVVSVILAGGFIEWTYWAMREAAIQTGLGHVQISRTGFREYGVSDPFAYLLNEQFEEVLQIDKVPEVKVVAPRLHFSGLISHGETSLSFLGEGVDPEREEHVSKVVRLTAGMKLSSLEPRSALLGKGLAASLGVRTGDNVVLMVATASGGMNAVEVAVRGVMTTEVKAFDDMTLRLPIDTARSLIRSGGSHLWVLALENTDQASAVTDRLKAQLDTSTLEVLSWLDLADFYRKAVFLFSRQMLIVEGIIGLIIVLSISNTLVMSVLERTSEIGTLMAIGVRRRAVVKLFLIEALSLGVIGGALGVAIGVFLAVLISAIGIPMPPPPGHDTGYSAEIVVTRWLVFGAFFLAVGATVLAGAYPAWKASRLVIVDALRRGR